MRILPVLNIDEITAKKALYIMKESFDCMYNILLEKKEGGRLGLYYLMVIITNLNIDITSHDRILPDMCNVYG